MENISIKEHAELRHALAHMYYAIQALAEGHAAEALYELKSIEGLVFWDSDEAMTAFCEAQHEKLQRQKELQGQEEVVEGRNREGVGQ